MMSGRGAGVPEIEELNRILTVERELVLKTQENYRILKEKFLGISRENEFLKQEHLKLQEGSEKYEAVERRTRSSVREFKVDTIEELQNVYRKELQDQNGQIEKLRLDRMDLVKENDQLLEEIAELNADLDDFKRREKGKEMEMKGNFDRKLKEIMMDNEKRVSPRLSHYEQTIEHLHAQLQGKEEVILEKSRAFSAEIVAKNSIVEELKRAEDSLISKVTNLEATIQNLNVQLLKQSNESELQLTIDGLKLKNEILLKERMDLEQKMRQDQREYSRRISDIEEKFAVRITEFEKLCEQKDGQMEELQMQLEKAEKLREDFEKCERNRQIEEEHRERLELEVKDLYAKLQKAGDDRQNSETSLKLERDRLEVSLVTLKKQLEQTPESPQNVEKLRKELRQMEHKLSAEKEKRQSTIREFSSAFKRVERQQKVFQEKFREKMTISFDVL
ncbi:unnamed protein product [Caenorhabditis sp. 36 PRJEB53466]|nr:unnamed protein product [Caenorhabditis sp. 36 PRJEB53466]